MWLLCGKKVALYWDWVYLILKSGPTDFILTQAIYLKMFKNQLWQNSKFFVENAKKKRTNTPPPLSPSLKWL